jgi:SAM-dependent methyltransferase
MMSPSTPADVPSPIDYLDIEQARAWVIKTVETRPWRAEFFAHFAAALNEERSPPFRVVELGSGPGHLAAVLLSQCSISQYVAVDFSPAMHTLAREHLGDLAERVTFCVRDFRDSNWASGLGTADVVVTHQAVHEVRHKDHQPALFRRVHDILCPNGLFLICDHYWEEGVPWKNVPLYLTQQEQLATLAGAEFADVEVLLDEGGMRLIRARRR